MMYYILDTYTEANTECLFGWLGVFDFCCNCQFVWLLKTLNFKRMRF